VSFQEKLIQSGWNELVELIHYRKGQWEVFFDTSSWIEVSTSNTPRVFDVAVPEPSLEAWTINLIEHLCKTDDELTSLRNL
jgi:hypothetical protein